ncbi:unnamed protein product, partial [Ectocarpus sp. 12 AP-2014]
RTLYRRCSVRKRYPDLALHNHAITGSRSIEAASTPVTWCSNTMPDIVYIGGQPFHYGQKLATAGHEGQLPGYVVKWGDQQFTFFEHRAD